jgi:hypothetical protein
MRALAVLRGRKSCGPLRFVTIDSAFGVVRALAFALTLVMLPVAARAACPVPNQITNGQVADATKMMDNFNAIGSCATSVGGSPTPGAIATISDQSSLAAGDLSGDVTTNGGTATTLAPSGVTPGNYVDANITVDAKGRVTAVTNGSSASGTTPIGAIVTQASQSIPNNVFNTVISFNAVGKNDGNYFFDANSPTRLTAPFDGWYIATMYSQWPSASGNCWSFVVAHTSTGSSSWSETYQTGTATQRNTITGVFYLQAGDYVTAEQAQTSGSSKTVLTTLALVKM